MVQSSSTQVHSCKSSRQDAVLCISAGTGRGKHHRDPSQTQQQSPASNSRCHKMGTRSRSRTVPADPASRHHPHPPSSTSGHHPHPSTFTSTKKTAHKSPKMDVYTNFKLGRNVDYIENATVLLDWIIKPLPDIRGVCVEGQKPGMDDYWHSAAIVEVVTPTLVVTASGSVYNLQGKINKYCTIDNGFPKDVAKLFTKGFPHNWRQVIQHFYRQLENSISIAAEVSPIKKRKLVLSQHHKLVGTVKKKKKTTAVSSHKLVGTVKKKKKTTAVSSAKLQPADQVEDSIWTPGGILKQKLSTDDVTVTRSGRISLPPLARWTGQCYRRIPNSSDIEVTFETDCAKKSLHDTTAQMLKLPKIPVDPSIKLFGGKLNQTVDVLGNIEKCAPVATDAVIRKKSVEALVAARDIIQEGRGNIIRPAVNNTHQHFAAAKHTQLKKANKINRSPECSNTSKQSPAISDVGEILDKPGACPPGLFNRSSTDVHTKTICDKSLRVVLSRHKLADVSTEQGITQVNKKARLPATSVHTVHDSQSGRRAHKYSSSNVHSDNSLRQSIDSSFNKSYSKRVRVSQTNQCIEADSRDSINSSSTAVQQQVKIRSKKTEHKMSVAGQRCARSDDETDGKPAATEKASATGSHLAGVVGLLPSTHMTQPPAAGKRKKVSAARKRKLDADDCPAKDERAGSDTTVGGKSSKRRKVMNVTSAGVIDVTSAGVIDVTSAGVIDVTSAGQVSWSRQEQDLLHRALKEVNGADSSYWEKVSAIVATRSQMECQQFYRHHLEARGNKKPKKVSNTSHKQKDKTGRKKGEPIRGGKGTLKRKQDLRQFLQEQNEGYEDNLFEGTPFVNRNKQSTLFSVNVDKNDSEIFGVNHNCITPVAGSSAISTPGARLRAKMVSVKKTPQSEHVMVLDDTPVSFNRRKADQYIKSFIDRQRKAEPGPVVVQNDTSTQNLSNLPVRSLFSPATHPGIVIDSHSTEEQHEDDEHSPYMYYWNDES